jgi:hypothetical protein
VFELAFLPNIFFDNVILGKYLTHIAILVVEQLISYRTYVDVHKNYLMDSLYTVLNSVYTFW